MLQVKNISKSFTTGELTQIALNDVSLNLRDNEFVAILGPSGSGKTTLLNIIGGLDRYDSGDLIINGISTKKYSSRDWDSYRNRTIGFVFQGYNLIPHQTILSNVELALTISGISRKERKERAKHALNEVGLGDQLHKRPNQLSGGQMQRVAIARALVNNPDVLLADEPTGALDSDTSVQVMELLKEVAKDRLVVMVTHNPELADKYATRVIQLRDGKILDDTSPFDVEQENTQLPTHKNMGKASMSWLTSLSLSFNNLRTKKARTLLTAFAGSIGIIGIALILSISNGVNNYISDIQKDTMTSYPITIDAQSPDFSALISATAKKSAKQTQGVDHDLDAVYPDSSSFDLASEMTVSINKNNLTEFKNYLDDPESEIHKYVGENGIVYSYDTKFGIYTYDSDGTLVNTDGSTLDDLKTNNSRMNVMSSFVKTESANDNFEEMLPNQDTHLISDAVMNNYELLYGSWPKDYNEVIFMVDQNNEIDASVLYQLGILPSEDFNELMKKLSNGEELNLNLDKMDYSSICDKEFYFIPECDFFKKNENGTFSSIKDDPAELKKLMESATKLKISGIVRPLDSDKLSFMSSSVGYTKQLTDYVMNYTENSEVVKAQKENPDTNILSGVKFSPSDDAQKVQDAKTYTDNLNTSEKAKMCKATLSQTVGESSSQMSQLSGLSESELAAVFDSYMQTASDTVFLEIYKNYISTGSYDDNMETFGVVSLDAPSSISIYADSFENKDSISRCISDYNANAEEEDQISYTDYVGLLMSSVTTIINVISYVLIAFVAVSLIVSSIMIGIITYISVLERTKEIGILRALGASKRNISQVFNAETFIIGLFSGIMGIAITLLTLIPGNMIIHSLTNTESVNAVLPPISSVLLVILSMILTFIGGIIPAKKAAKKDPVVALRTE